jgi:3D (Asp-Asp-Asp) domain-containing protein
MRKAIAIVTLLLIGIVASAKQKPGPAGRKTRVFIATAHSQEGSAASGEQSRKGTVAADPKVLPLGSLIHITRAGKYSGKYKVIDTGPGVKGRRIDIYMESLREARRFGRRRVRVMVLRRGYETQQSAAAP